MTYEKVVKKAESVLKRFGVTKVPVPIEDIVEALGIRLGYAPSSKYSGILIRKADKGILLGVNTLESSERIRFTIAHELGHYFLDDKKVSVDFRVTDYDFNDKPQIEKFADVFAANILMPEKIVRKDFGKISKGKVFLEDDLIGMASKYRVSKGAMRVRLEVLNLI